MQPVALRYGERGAAQTVVAFRPGESFAAISCACSASRRARPRCCFLDPIDAGEAGGRRRIAELARERIVAAMQGG